jgi:hypothetical protein
MADCLYSRIFLEDFLWNEPTGDKTIRSIARIEVDEKHQYLRSGYEQCILGDFAGGWGIYTLGRISCAAYALLPTGSHSPKNLLFWMFLAQRPDAGLAPVPRGLRQRSPTTANVRV